jgi:hypothetical protein
MYILQLVYSTNEVPFWLNTHKEFYFAMYSLQVLPSIKERQAGFFTKLVVLTKRSSVNMHRDIGYYWLRFAILSFVCFCIGTVFYNISDTSLGSIQVSCTYILCSETHRNRESKIINSHITVHISGQNIIDHVYNNNIDNRFTWRVPIFCRGHEGVNLIKLFSYPQENAFL